MRRPPAAAVLLGFESEPRTFITGEIKTLKMPPSFSQEETIEVNRWIQVVGYVYFRLSYVYNLFFVFIKYITIL